MYFSCLGWRLVTGTHSVMDAIHLWSCPSCSIQLAAPVPNQGQTLPTFHW